MSHEVLERVRAARVVAVVRAPDSEEAVRIAEALAAGGIRAIELTFTTPGAEAALAATRQRLGDGVLLGAGTITTPAQVDAASAAGADFLVSPHLNVALLESMLTTGALSVPGVLTPSEVVAARSAGAVLLKLFPASAVGTTYLKALYGPFPGLQVMVTGGVSPGTAREWLAAGAVAVGLGGELVPKELREARAWDKVSQNASRLLAALRMEEGSEK
jgi:2-dehydro-3-deoxyphosphogluconate aldolase/(4S)-4-hydroxy-2-oxoglutarate aldolase